VSVLFASTGLLLANLPQGSQAHGMLSEMTRAFGDAFTGTGPVSAGKAFLFGVLLSGTAQIGDLFESCVKRDAHIKDSGSVLPHYGGILDLVDSPLFALPVAWFLLTRVWNIP
jgi:CDP-diglyceride synthetase